VFNGLAMLVVFFLCRIAIYPFFFYVYGLSAGAERRKNTENTNNEKS
jgi:hypothetical protein